MPQHADDEPSARAARAPRRCRPSACALTRRPSPSRSGAWWWHECVRVPAPRISARRVPGPTVDRVERVAARRALVGVAASAGAGAGLRRRATFRSCMPRQMPSTGMSRRSASRISASSVRSRCRCTPRGLGCSCCAVERRIEVGSAAEDEPVEQVEQLGRCRRRAGSAIGRPPAALDRRGVGGRDHDAAHVAPVRERDRHLVGADADHRAGCGP